MSESQTFTVVVLPSVEEQLAAGNTEVIDPLGVDLTEWQDGNKVPSPLFADGNSNASHIVGIWKDPRVVDGRLVVDVRLQDRFELVRVAETDKGREPFRYSFTGIHAAGVARLIAVNVHANREKG